MAKSKSKKRSHVSAITRNPAALAGVAIILILAVGLYIIFAKPISNGRLYLTPATSTVALSSTFTIAVDETSANDGVNAVETDLAYDQTRLQFIGINTSDSAFSLHAIGENSGTIIRIARANHTPLTGNHLVANITFKAIALGTTAINFTSTSSLIRAKDITNILHRASPARVTIE